MKPFAIVCTLAVLSVVACRSDAQEACFEKRALSSCGEACHHDDDQKACALRDEIGIKECMTDGKVESCTWMCLFSDSGKDVYCNHIRKMCSEQNNQQACKAVEENLF